MSLSKRPRSDSSDSDADAAGRRAAQKLRVDAGALVTTKITENGRNPLLDLLFEPNRYGKTCERICSLAGLSNTLKLRQVCKKASGLHRYLWDVNHCLSRFVKDQKAFRSQMGKHDVLISGSFALQFFERVFWKDSDLDVFVKRGQGAEAFGSYLCEKEGYKLLDVKDQDVYAMRDLTEIRTYLRPDNTKIQLIGVENVPVQAVLRGFYTTAVVNFISWNKAFAIFPQPTFLHHKTYLLKCLDPYFAGLMTKYSERGWRSRDIMWPEENTPSTRSGRIDALVIDTLG